MKLIIKPAGIVFLVLSLVALVFLAVRNRAGEAPSATPNTATPSGTASKPSPVAASPASAVPPADWSKARQVLAPDIASNKWRLLVNENATGATGVANADVPGHPVARVINVTKAGQNPWDAQIAHPLSAPFKKGQVFRLTYYARSAQSCPVSAVVEQAGDPYEKLAYRTVTLTPEWKQYSEEWVQELDTPADWSHINFQVGSKAGKVEITGVILVMVEPSQAK